MTSKHRFVAGLLVVAFLCAVPATAGAQARQPLAAAEWPLVSGLRSLWQTALLAISPAPVSPAHRATAPPPVCLGPGGDPNGCPSSPFHPSGADPRR